jgi:thiosulfate/3-mercaptopyruvate sulfurtransferase
VNAGGPGREGPLVSTAWLEANLGLPGIRIIDVRGQVLPPGNTPRYAAKRAAFDEAHIPGARFVDWTRDIVDRDDPVPVQVADAATFARAMETVGVGDDSLVVAYDDYNHIFAGRLAWALRFYGHDAAFILDGGWSRWTSEGRPTSQDQPVSSSARFTPRPRPAFRRTAEELSLTLGRSDVLVIDARAPDQYAGRASVARRGGHIPGARNVHYARLVDSRTGKFLPRDDLARVFAEGGVDVRHLPAEVVVYCNSGVSCTVPLNALRLLGRDDAAVYDGSWNEWGNDESLPIAAGSDP